MIMFFVIGVLFGISGIVLFVCMMLWVVFRLVFRCLFG